MSWALHDAAARNALDASLRQAQRFAQSAFPMVHLVAPREEYLGAARHIAQSYLVEPNPVLRN